MNPKHGWVDYHERIGRITAHIHEHFAQPLELVHLAELAHLSPYHCHRVYHALLGETIASTVRRLRLQRASGYLANTQLAVAAVARKCGYPNVQSFARAFSSAYGVSPSDYRKSGGHTVFAGLDPVLPLAYAIEVRDVPKVTLAGGDHRGSYMGVGKAFNAAYARLAAAGLVEQQTRWFAVYYDDPFAVPEAQLASRAGLSLPATLGASDKLPAPLERFELGGTPCAVLRHQGPYATMRAAYKWLYGHWLVQSGFGAANLPVFEEYLNNPSQVAAAELLTDIYLPLVVD